MNVRRTNSREIAERLFDCALLILRDGCPPDPARYLCLESEDFDETACGRCWEDYLYKTINGEV